MNAVQYSDSKTQICIRSYKDDDRTIAIEVENLGWGISEEDLKPVEQSFYQAIPERSELGGIGWAYRLLLDTSCAEDPFRYTVNWDRAPRESYSSVDSRGSGMSSLEWGLTNSAGSPDPRHSLRRTPWRGEDIVADAAWDISGCDNSTCSRGHSIQSQFYDLLC